MTVYFVVGLTRGRLTGNGRLFRQPDRWVESWELQNWVCIVVGQIYEVSRRLDTLRIGD